MILFRYICEFTIYDPLQVADFGGFSMKFIFLLICYTNSQNTCYYQPVIFLWPTDFVVSLQLKFEKLIIPSLY